jgi:hypothetical protein
VHEDSATQGWAIFELCFAVMATVESRKSPRRQYIHRELVADFDSQTVPELSDFYWVTFLNISDTGAAFLSSHKPETEKVIIVLGSGPSVVARIVRTSCLAESPEAIYEVGCEFERRLST